MHPISAIVPTRNRPESLARCLAALRAQSAVVELVVADDAVPRNVPGGVADLVVATGGAGPASARNAAVRVASGQVVLFCDDDCEPEPTWAERLAAACPAGGAAAGSTRNADDSNRWAAASQHLTSSLQVASLDGRGNLGFAPTSNLAMDRSIAVKNPFDETFPLAAGEDREWCARIISRGVQLRHVPDAVVWHRQLVAGPAAFARQQFRYGRGAATLASRGFDLEPHSTRRELIRSSRALGAGGIALVAGAQLAVAAGFLAERLRGRAATRQVAATDPDR